MGDSGRLDLVRASVLGSVADRQLLIVFWRCPSVVLGVLLGGVLPSVLAVHRQVMGGVRVFSQIAKKETAEISARARASYLSYLEGSRVAREVGNRVCKREPYRDD